MTVLYSLLTVLFLQPAGDDRAAILTAWTQRSAQAPAGELSLTIERDSRDATFGRPRTSSTDASHRIRFTPDLLRFDGPRLTVMRRDGRTQAAESDPDRARIEFRNVLLEEQLASPQATPRFEPATWILHADGRESGQRLALVDKLLAEAPLRATQPLRFMNPARVRLLDDTEPPPAYRRLVDPREGGLETELWIERETPHRPLRMIGRTKDHDTWQIDITWSNDDPASPAKLLVQTLGQAGEPLDVVEATVIAASPFAPDATASLAELPGPNPDEPAPPNAPLVA
ncbi:MAG TPA: hypothetical protein VM452_19245, partial [Caulifigura sp.]|nr:hypothetical protein [Caulifigura sp.]